MSKQDFILEASPRSDVGKGASRRLRRLAGEIPAIIYGAGKEPESVTIPHKDIARAVLNEAFFSHIITLKVAGKEQSVVIKDLQGGISNHLMNDLEITCLPGKLPEYIEVFMAELHVGESIHISDLALPEGVTSVELSHGEEHDQPVAACVLPRAAVEESTEDEADAGEAADSADDSDDDGEKADD